MNTNKVIKKFLMQRSIKALALSSLIMCANAYAGQMADVSNIVLAKINSSKLQQNAVLKVYDNSLAAQCTTLVMDLMAADAKGQLDATVAKGGGVMAAMTAYYRQYSLANGVPLAVYDKMMEPYFNEYRRNNYQVSDATFNACVAANGKFLYLISH